MLEIQDLPLEKRMELSRQRGYKYGRGLRAVPESEFDEYFEFYLKGASPADRALLAKEFWAGVDAGKAVARG